MERKKAQVWVETVVYTLIGISIIGILLAIAKPRIEAIQDRLIIEQTIDSLNQIHTKVLETQDAPGNQKVISMKLSKGKLILDGKNNLISWEMESTYEYSQLDSLVSLGKISVITEEGNPFKVSLLLNYSELDLLTDGKNESFKLEESPTPYTLVFRNEGSKINMEVRD
jgi:hypothetical protein